MNAIRVMYENGVFRPLVPVDLPEHTELDFELRVVEPTVAQRIEGVRGLDPGLAAIYEVLSHRHNSGHHDTASRHNEHQP